MAKHARRSTASAAEQRQRLLLDQLKEVAVALGLEVREEKLVREVGYSVRSGPCKLEGRDLMLLDANAALGERIEAMLEVLAGQDLDSIYIEPALRQLIQGRRTGEERPGEG